MVLKNQALTQYPLLLLVHGWGFGPGVWRSVIRALPNWDYHTLDLGFFGKPQQQIPEERPLLAIGHSLGFLWLLQHLEQAPMRKFCLGLVSISGFSRFAHCNNFPHGIAPKILQRMGQQIPKHGSKVLAEFRQQSGWHGSPGQKPIHNPTSLLQGLDWLQQWDGRDSLKNWDGPLSILAAKDDQIVPPQLTTACFAADSVHWVMNGGHILPITRAEECANTIKNLGNLLK